MKQKWIYIIALVLILSLYPSFNTKTTTDERFVLADPVEVKTEEISIEFGNISQHDFVIFLSNCIDKIPKSKNIETFIPKDLIVAQAGHESAWGNSRFAKEANNLFGIRTWDSTKPQVKPLGIKNSPWGIIKFDDQCGSVYYYYELINNHSAYRGFRMSRSIMIENNQPVDSLILVEFLSMFSELGQEYVLRLKKSIKEIRTKYPWLQQY